jgi:glucokinase
VSEPLLLAADVGGTTIAAGLVTHEGEVLAHLRAPTHERGPGTAVETLLDLLGRLSRQARGEGRPLDGAGIGVAGTVDAAAGVVGGLAHNVPELAGVRLGALVGARLGLPTWVDNDVNVLALGEWMWGAGRGTASLVVLALGTGVGGGIILDGQLHRGRSGFGGELGHVPINFDGPACFCGGRGCLSVYVSGRSLAARGTERLGRPVEAAAVFQLAREGNVDARALVDQACEALGAALAVIVNGLDPECLLLAGSVAWSLQPLEGQIREHLARFAFAPALAATRLEILALDKRATVRGGAALVLYETLRRSGGRA